MVYFIVVFFLEKSQNPWYRLFLWNLDFFLNSHKNMYFDPFGSLLISNGCPLSFWIRFRRWLFLWFGPSSAAVLTPCVTEGLADPSIIKLFDHWSFGAASGGDCSFDPLILWMISWYHQEKQQCNYNEDANTDDGSCVAVVTGCTTPLQISEELEGYPL